jgi:hypothetical protein
VSAACVLFDSGSDCADVLITTGADCAARVSPPHYLAHYLFATPCRADGWSAAHVNHVRNTKALLLCECMRAGNVISSFVVVARTTLVGGHLSPGHRSGR